MGKTICAFLLVLLLVSCKKENDFSYPLVFTGDVINLTDTSATFTAKISNTGAFPIIESGFVWGVHAQDNNGVKIKNDSNTEQLFSQSTNEKLLPGKTYYVRAYIQTEKATSYGREVTFQTKEGPDTSGKWSRKYHDEFEYGWCEYISSSFTIQEKTYFALSYDGVLYSYNHVTNTFKFELNNEILSDAAQSFAYQGNGYIFSRNSIYLFDPITKSIRQLANRHNNGPKDLVTGFVINENIYIGLGSVNRDYTKEFWSYNIPSNTWQQIAPFPGEYRVSGYSFSMNNTGYVGGGYYSYYDINPRTIRHKDLWAYLPEKNQWIKKEDLPIKNEDYLRLGATNTAKSGYVFHKNEFFEYNSIFNFWDKKAKLVLPTFACNPYLFAANNKLFILAIRNYDGKRNFTMWAYEK